MSYKLLVQTNDVSGNHVLVYDRASNGALTIDQTIAIVNSYNVPQKGGNLSSPNLRPDPLTSQGSLIYDANHGLVFVVNAGNNSIAVLRFHYLLVREFQRLSQDKSPAPKHEPIGKLSIEEHAEFQKLMFPEQIYRPLPYPYPHPIPFPFPFKLISVLELQQVLTSGGKFPVSLTVNGNFVYVLNVLGGGSIQGYEIGTNGALSEIQNSNHLLNINTTDPNSTPGEIAFTPDGKTLVITTKANGKLLGCAVNAQGVASAPVVLHSSQNNPFPFGFTFDLSGNLVVTEVGLQSIATFTAPANGTATYKASGSNGAAACWVVRSGEYYYVVDNGNNAIVVYSLSAALIPTQLQTVGLQGNGPVDLAVTSDGKFLYVQTGGPGGNGASNMIVGYPIMPNGQLGSALPTPTMVTPTGIEGIAAT